MNVEIAQRLAELRREKGYSQEELAEHLGLSRQAVSKWERAESSPDTGNLIALAKLYRVTLDDLLQIEADIDDDVKFELRDRAQSTESKAQAALERANLAAAQASAAAVSAQAASDQAHKTASAYYAQVPAAAPAAAPAYAQAPAHQAPQARPQAYAPGAPVPPAPHSAAAFPHAPAPVAAPYQAPATVLPLTKKEKRGPWISFPYPIVCVIVFLFMGFFIDLWHPGWVIFLTIPLYYWVANIIENDPNYRK